MAKSTKKIETESLTSAQRGRPSDHSFRLPMWIAVQGEYLFWPRFCVTNPPFVDRRNRAIEVTLILKAFEIVFVTQGLPILLLWQRSFVQSKLFALNYFTVVLNTSALSRSCSAKNLMVKFPTLKSFNGRCSECWLVCRFLTLGQTKRGN